MKTDRPFLAKVRMMQQGTVIITSLAVLLGAGCGGSSTSAGGGSGDEVVVTIKEQNGSGISGKATLTAEGEKTRVVLELKNRSANPVARPQPAHIHEGSCANLAPDPAYGLTDVKGGLSTSTVDAKLGDLTDGALAINVHESADNIERYVACGDFGERNSASPPGYDKETDY